MCIGFELTCVDAYAIERWNIFNEQLGVSMIDYILARPANLELIFINDVFHVRK